MPTSTAGGDGSIVTFDVPAEGSPPGEHKVTAACRDALAEAPFTVIAIATPALKLDKNAGLPGSQLTANGTGFACGDDRVQLLWDGNTPLRDTPSGTFSLQLTVPADASPGQHTMVATCRNHADITDSQSFAVTKATIGAPDLAALALAPARGAPGDAMRVIGDHFACTNSRIVQLSWDSQPLVNPSADASGHFDTSIAVPGDAAAGSHTIHASCAAGSAAALAGFTVVPRTIPTTNPQTNSTPPQSPSIAGWLVLLIVGALAVLAYRHWRRSRSKPKPNPRVYATVSHPSGLPVVTMHETPAPGEAAHALRLQAHADAGTQTLSEVNDDHTTK